MVRPKIGELISHMACSAAKCTNNDTSTDLALTLRDRATLSVLHPLVLFSSIDAGFLPCQRHEHLPQHRHAT